MDCLNKHDVKEIIEMLEDELDFVPKLTAADKMMMRSKIRRQDNWLSVLKNPTTKGIFMKLNARLYDVFCLYPYGFSDKLKETLDVKLALLHKRAANIRSFMDSCQSNMNVVHEPKRQAA
jgi:hypothetical protein